MTAESDFYFFRQLNTKGWGFRIMFGFSIVLTLIGILKLIENSRHGLAFLETGSNSMLPGGILLLGTYVFRYSSWIRIDEKGVTSKTLFRYEFLEWKEITDCGVFIHGEHSTTRIDPDEDNFTDPYSWKIIFYFGEGYTYTNLDYDEEAWRLVKKYRWC
jgi:hypothetical protein